MSAPTKPDARLAVDLARTLARLRTARRVDPGHFLRRGERRHRGSCEVCDAEWRLNWLLEKVPPRGK